MQISCGISDKMSDRMSPRVECEATMVARSQIKVEEGRQRRLGILAILWLSFYYWPLFHSFLFRTNMMVGFIVLTFLFCWFPFAIMFALSPFSPGIRHFFRDNKLEDLVTWLGNHSVIIPSSKELYSGYSNSFLNPMIYAIMNPTIRKTMKKQMGKVFC